MPRTPAAFKQSDLAKAVRAVRAAGLEVFRTEITAQGIKLIHKQDAMAEPPDAALDAWKARRDARTS